ncbi:hypothetical protein E2C01_070134 [Portunus trituberculatus]|uniref:Uncharacterized protein n=1 Tax=Portunus trituberculatus TaxID=210409 RepID=A0A5B7HTE1_PORTR|nr:hypothetical protein [Portunus trituberculatus]
MCPSIEEVKVPTSHHLLFLHRSTTENQYHPYSTTPHSKSVNLIRTDHDYRKNTDVIGGIGGGIPEGGGTGIGRGIDFTNYGMELDYKMREDGRNRQRSDRLEYDKKGGVEGFFPPPEGGNGHGSSAPSTHTPPKWRGLGWSFIGLVSVARWLLVNPF